MAHMIATVGGKANFAYIGEQPWWTGLEEKTKDGKKIIMAGTKMEPNATIDEWQDASGFRFNAIKVPQYYEFGTETDENGVEKPVRFESSNSVIIRDDIGIELGICKDRYQLVQPNQIAMFFKSVIEEYGFTLETMGVLDQGQRIWALAKVGDNFSLAGGDKVEQYCLLSTSFDRSIATQAMFTTVRVVCHNTLTLAYSSGSSATVRISHATKFEESKLKVDLGLHRDTFARFEEQAAKLSSVKVADEDAKVIITDLFMAKKRKDNPEAVPSTKGENIIANVYNLYKGNGIGSKLEAANGSLWGVLNAVTEYVDHHQGRNLNNRLKAAWWGVGSNFKQDAFQHITKLAA